MHPTTAIVLPPELKHYIGSFCTPNSLASLAQVHTSFQQEAERVLYQTLSLYTGTLKEVKCLETLSTNSEKASLVRSLSVEFTSEWNDVNSRAIVSLSNALGRMYGLCNLRIRLPNGRSWKEWINKPLRDKHFQLHTLCCDDFLDISGIIEKQPKLQHLGIYANGGYLVKMLQGIDRHSPFPTIFALERESFLPFFDHVSIFPAFFPDNATMCRALTDLFDRDLGRRIRTIKGCVTQVSVYLTDFSDMALIRDVVEDVALRFPTVDWLNFSLQCPSRIQHPEIKKILSFVTELRELNFYFWGIKTPHGGPWVLPDNIKMEQAKEWKAVCPHLRHIRFLDASMLENKDSVWIVR